jgi:hypothetical protein
MSFTNNPPSFNQPPWSKEWAAYLQATLLWKYQDWNARRNSPMLFTDYTPGRLLPIIPMPEPAENPGA